MRKSLSPLSAKDYRVLAHFRHQIRRFLCFSERAARSAGLQPQQHQLLLSIKGLPPGAKPTVGALAWLLQLRHHSTVELLNRLVRRGLVRRQRSDADQRAVLIFVTPKGQRVLERLTLLHRNELRRNGPALLRALTSVFIDLDLFGADEPSAETPGTSGRPRKSKRPRSPAG